MSATAGHPSLRARLAETVEGCIDEMGQRPTARLLGCDAHSVSRRGSDLHLWPTDDLLRLALHHRSLLHALDQYLHGDDQQPGEAVAATGALFDALKESADLVAEASADLRDGRIDAEEAQRLMPLARQLCEHLGQTVIPSLERYLHA